MSHVSKKSIPYTAKRDMANELIELIEDRDIDIRVKPDYKDSHMSIVRLAKAMFWCFRNWYETSIPVIYGVMCFILWAFQYYFGVTFPLYGISLMFWGSGVVSLICLAVFEYLRVTDQAVVDKTFDDFYTQIGQTIYVPSDLKDYLDRVGWHKAIRNYDSFHRVMRHEMLHVLQKEHWGKDMYHFTYIFPLMFVTFRGFQWEKEAYTQNLLMYYHESEDNTISESKRKWVAKQFSSPSYAFMWVPFPIPGLWSKPARSMVDRQANKIESGEVQGLYPYKTNTAVGKY
jgi:hypothetical protein